MNTGLIALIVGAVIALVVTIVKKKPSEITPSPEPEIVDRVSEPTTYTSRTYRTTIKETTDLVAKDITSKPDPIEKGLEDYCARQAASKVYKVSYRDPITRQWTSTNVAAPTADDAATLLGLKAGHDCFVSYQVDVRPTEEMKVEQVATARTIIEATATKETQKTALSEATTVYHTIPVADRIAVSLIKNPPTGRSLSLSEKQRIADFEAKSASDQAEAAGAYDSYKAAGGTGG